MRSTLFFVMLVAACTPTSRPAVAPVTCPTIVDSVTSSPSVIYRTFVLDGKVVAARRAQRNVNMHGPMPLDSNSTEPDFSRVRISEIRLLTGDSARFYEPCPGVRVVAIDSERRRWWRW